MDESSVFQRLKLRICRPEDRFERVENGLLTGMPDVNYCLVGVEGWIELKCPDEPKRPDTPLFGSNHKVEVEQRNWMLRQARAGGRGWLFIATEQRLMLIEGKKVGDLSGKINEMTTHQLERISKWRVQLPILDQTRWFDLREILSSST